MITLLEKVRLRIVKKLKVQVFCEDSLIAQLTGAFVGRFAQSNFLSLKASCHESEKSMSLPFSRFVKD